MTEDDKKDKLALDFLKNIKNCPCIVNLRSNRKLCGIVRVIDHHFNMILTDVTEIRKTKSKNKGVKKREGTTVERKIKCLVLRGDSVISVCEA